MITSTSVATRKHVDSVGLAAGLLRALNEHPVRYCVWKGSDALAEGLAGRDDLDLLVDPSHFPAALAILTQYGFKRAESIAGLETPGVFHFYGFDVPSAAWIHIHLYTRLLTGESLVLTHWLPLEAMLLQGRKLVEDVHVASRCSELAVFILRAMIKQGSLLELIRDGGRSRQTRDKLVQLLDGCEPRAAYACLSPYCRVIDADLFNQCVRALRDEWPLRRKLLLGRQVRRQLRPYRRFNSLGRLSQYGRLAWGKARRRLSGQRAKKFLSRGLVLALVGADATGKSTLGSVVHRWLSETFVTRRLHLGKPTSSWFTMPVNVLMPLARCAFPRLRHSGQGRPKGNAPRRSPSLLQAVRAMALAWDRNRLVRKAHRYAAAGEIVICDRYPSSCFGAMDSPRLQEMERPVGIKSRLINLLARWERRLYERNPPPDAVIKLTVSIETARRRNQQRSKADKHSDEDLIARHQGFHSWNTCGKRGTVEISTEGDLNETRAALLAAVWHVL